MSELIVALDGMDANRALKVASDLTHLRKDGLWGFKIGHSLTFEGANWIAELKKLGNVFVDLKLYDIPNTVENAVYWLAGLNVDLTTVHLSMGRTSLERIADQGVGILGVSLLTSAIPTECERIYGRSTVETLHKLFLEAGNTGIAGVVCSPLDLSLLDQTDPSRHLMRVCPGIRRGGDTSCDQVRFMAPSLATSAGADLLVVGRPIVEQVDYLNATKSFLES
jgi:orotidine-5'-phosphate decarboxylase